MTEQPLALFKERGKVCDSNRVRPMKHKTYGGHLGVMQIDDEIWMNA